jgi:hypothetical protein
MVKFEDLKIGQHLWVLYDNQLVMVAKFQNDGIYEVCGEWQFGLVAAKCKIIKLVHPPKKYQKTKMYYAD